MRPTRRTRATAPTATEGDAEAPPLDGGSPPAPVTAFAVENVSSGGVFHRLLNFAMPGGSSAAMTTATPPRSPGGGGGDVRTPDAKRQRREAASRSTLASAVQSPAASRRSSGQSSGTAVAETASEVGLICGVCLEVMCRPTTNVCGHTFCLPCLREVVERAKPPGSAGCPVCRIPLPKEATHLGENKVLIELLQRALPDVYRVGESRGAQSRQTDSDVRALFEAVARRDPSAVSRVLERSADHANIILQGSGPASGASASPLGLGPLVAALASGEPDVVRAMVGRMNLVHGAAISQEQLNRVPMAPPGHGPQTRYRTLLQLHMDDPGVTGFRLRNRSYLTRAEFSQAALEAAGALRRNSHVTRLDLDVWGADANLDSLTSALAANRGIKTLRLTVCASFGKVCRALSVNQNVRSLILRRDDMSDDLSAGELGVELMIFRELGGLLKANRNIVCLDLASSLRSKYWMEVRPTQRKQRDKDIGEFATSLKRSVNLETLSLRWDVNYGEGNFVKLCAALAGLPKLRNLIFDATEFTEGMSKELAKAISKRGKSLSSLQFKDLCRIHAKGLGSILDAVSECDSLAMLVLEDAEFYENFPGGMPPTKLVATHLARMLAKNSNLQYLVISRVDYTGSPTTFGDWEMAHILGALGRGKNTHLLGLCISGQQASLSKGCAAAAFAGNTTLVDLALAGNRIGKAGAREIASILACKGNAIRRLSLSYNALLGNKTCMEVLSAGVAASPKLAHLNLDTVSLTDGGLSVLLEKCIVANKAKHLTRLAIPNNNLTSKACALVTGALAKNSVLQGLDLRSNPHIPRGEYGWLGRTATFVEHVRSVCSARLKAGRLYLRGADPTRLVDDLGDAYLLFPYGVKSGGLLIKDDWDADPAADPVNEFRGPQAVGRSAGRMYRSQEGFEVEDDEDDDDEHPLGMVYRHHGEGGGGMGEFVPMALEHVMHLPTNQPLFGSGPLGSIMALFSSSGGLHSRHAYTPAVHPRYSDEIPSSDYDNDDEDPDDDSDQG